MKLRSALYFSYFMAGLLCLLSLAGPVHAQGAPRVVTFSKLVLQEGYVDASSGLSGIKIKSDVAFSWEEEDYAQRIFRMTYRLDQNNTTVMRSDNENVYVPTLTAALVTYKGKKGMACTGVELFVPYLAINLESGPQRADMVFSLANDGGTYTDCFKTTINFTHKKIVRYDLNKQGFTFTNLQFDYAAKDFTSNDLGVAVMADVSYKYGPEESLEKDYEVYLVLRSAGKVIYDSQKSNDFSNQNTSLDNRLESGKAMDRFKMFAKYRNIALEGPHDVEVVVILKGTEGGPREIFSQKVTMNLPYQYNFEDQEFTFNSVQAVATKRGGVSGIDVQYSCGFKQTGIMRGDQRSYYFYAVIMDAAGKVVIAPERASTLGAKTTHLQDAQLPSADHATAKGSLFIPLHLLNLPAGNHDLKFALMVSDLNLQTKFPVLAKGAVSVVKPAEVKYNISLERLEVIPANYDSDVVGISSPNPELQYVFAVGEDNYYQSSYDRNSLVAIPGAATLRLSEGDPIQVVLYDVDSGFFNESDLQGRWDIAYDGKGNSFYYEVNNTGQVVALRIKVTRVN